ncbi:MAG TPA: DUF2695 domain-containing protein [Jiangellaceae bacterium]
MDFDTTIADEAAAYLRSVTPNRARSTAASERPSPGECLRCYIQRLVTSHGCDTSLRFTRRWLSDSSFANPERLLRWFESSGGYCDCEVLMNVLPDHWPLQPAEADP